MSIEYARLLLALVLAALIAGLASLLAVLANKVPVPSLWGPVKNVTQSLNKTNQVQIPLSEYPGIGKFLNVPLRGFFSGLLNETVLEIYGKTGTHYLRVTVVDLFEGDRWVSSRNIYSNPSQLTGRVCSSCVRVCYRIVLHVPMTFLPHVKYITSLRILSARGKVSVEYYPKLDVVEVEPAQVVSYYACSLVPSSGLDTLRGLTLNNYRSISVSSTYLQVPEQDVQILRKFVKEVAGSCGQDVYCIVSKLVHYIKTHYSYYRYGAPVPLGVDVVKYLIYNATVLNCIQANTLIALALRSIGIPTRIVVGFYIKPNVAYQKVKFDQLHAWAEVYNPKTHTWVRVDATPPGYRWGSSGGQAQSGSSGYPSSSGRGGKGGRGVPEYPTLVLDLSRAGSVKKQLESQGVSPYVFISNPSSSVKVRFLRVLVFGNFTRDDKWRTTYYDFYWNNMTSAYETYCEFYGYYLCRYFCYSVRTPVPVHYVPHVAVLEKLRNIEYIHYFGGDVVYVKSPSTYFSECSLKLNTTFVIENTPFSLYNVVKVPQVYLSVPFSEQTVSKLRRVLLALVHSCSDLKCVIDRVRNFVSSGQLLKVVTKEGIHDRLLRSLLAEAYGDDSSVAEATIVALLLRLVNVPTRLVVGYYAHGREFRLAYRVDVYVPILPGLWVSISPKSNGSSIPPPYSSSSGGGQSQSRTYAMKYKLVIKVVRGSCVTFRVGIVTREPLEIEIRPHVWYIYARPSRVVIPSGSYVLKFLLCADPHAKLGLASADILVRYDHRVDKHRLNILVVARTKVVITKVYPTYVAPGYTIHVAGKVIDDLGNPVPSGTVVITLNKTKQSQGIRLCAGAVVNGTFSLVCKVPPQVRPGKYLIVAHYEGSLLYLPSKSDPYIYIAESPLTVPIIHVRCPRENIDIIDVLNVAAPEYEATLLVPCKSFLLTIITSPAFSKTLLEYYKSNNIQNVLTCVGSNITCRLDKINVGNMLNPFESNITYLITLRSNQGFMHIFYPGSAHFATFDMNIKLIHLKLDVNSNISSRIPLLGKIRLRLNILPALHMFERYVRNITVELLLQYRLKIAIVAESQVSNNGTVMSAAYTMPRVSPIGECTVLKSTTWGVHDIDFVMRCVPELYSPVVILFIIGNEYIAKRIADRVVIYSKLVAEYRYSLNKSMIRIWGRIIDPLAEKASVSLPYPVRVCAKYSRGELCREFRFDGAVANFSLTVPRSSRIELTAYAPYHVPYRSTIVVSGFPFLKYIVALLVCVCALSLALVYVRSRLRRRGVSVLVREFSRRVRIGQDVVDVKLLVENYDVLQNVWGVCDDVRVRICISGSGISESDVRLRIDGVYEGSGFYHEVKICDEGVYVLRVFVRDFEVLNVRIFVIDYRREIGRLFRDYVAPLCKVVDFDKLTPRQIADRLVSLGYDRGLVLEIVNIHELATYSDRPVSRDVFIRFLTCLSSLGVDVSRRYS